MNTTQPPSADLWNAGADELQALSRGEVSGSRRRRLDAEFLRAAVGWGIAGIIVVAPFAIGTVHDVTRVAVFLACAALFAATLLERLRSGKRFAVTVPLVALAVAAGATGLQLVPLPRALLPFLSPRAHEIFETSIPGYSSHALSLEPAGTLAELSKLLAYFAFYAAACVYASRRERRRFIVMAIAASATLNALLGLVQAAVGTHKILFFYTPEAEWGSLVRGTFVNPNHFGALLCLGAPCAIALAALDRKWRTPALLSLLVINVAAVLSLGRISILAIVAGQLVTLLLFRLPRRGSRTLISPRMVILSSTVVVAGLAIAGFFGVQQLQHVWAQSSLEEVADPQSKYQAWRHALQLTIQYPFTGVGRGAFEQAFTQVSPVAGSARFTWVENAYLQAFVDWGVPVATLLLVLAGWAAVMAAKRIAHDPMLFGSLGAMIALCFHEAADFAIELPGLGLPAVALLATLFARRSSQSQPGRRRVAVATPFLLVPAGIAAVIVLQPAFGLASSDGAALLEASRDRKVPANEIIAQGERLIARHPADYFIPLAVAERLASEQHRDTIKWINLAIALNPAHPAPHLLAAELLASIGKRKQALIEYKAAATKIRNSRMIWEYVVKRYPTLPDLVETVPDSIDHLLLLWKWLGSKGRLDDAEHVLELVIERDPGNVRALTLLARRAVERGDLAQAPKRVQALLRHDYSPESRRLDVQAKIAGGELAAAIQTLDAGIDRGPETFKIELALADALARKGEFAKARERLDRLERTWERDRPLTLSLYETRAQVEQLAGNEYKARWEMDRRRELMNR